MEIIVLVVSVKLVRVWVASIVSDLLEELLSVLSVLSGVQNLLLDGLLLCCCISTFSLLLLELLSLLQFLLSSLLVLLSQFLSSLELTIPA